MFGSAPQAHLPAYLPFIFAQRFRAAYASLAFVAALMVRRFDFAAALPCVDNAASVDPFNLAQRARAAAAILARAAGDIFRLPF